MKRTASRITGLLLTLAITLTVSGWVPFTAPVTIHSTPEGAEVYNAGTDELLGTTPYSTRVFLFSKELELRMNKFDTVPVELNYNSEKDIFKTLTPTPVLVYTKPSAEIFEADSDKLIGETPMDVQVFMDSRDYVVKKHDYYNQDVAIGLQTDNPQIIELKHRPLITIN
jgi:hypothetical protein